MKVSCTKTEYMKCAFSGNQTNDCPIMLQGQVLPKATRFKYLGSFLDSEGGNDYDITNRIKQGWLKWRQVTAVTCDSRMPLKLKGKVYKTVVRLVPTSTNSVIKYHFWCSSELKELIHT